MVSDKSVLSRKEREFIKRGEDILETSIRLFKENGPSSVSMDQIAVELGVARGTLYLHFKGKDELMIRIVLNRHIQLLKEFEKMDLTLNSKDLAKETIRVYLKHNLDSLDDYLLQKKCEELIQYANASDEILKEIEEEKQKRINFIEKIFNKAKEEKRIKEIPNYLLIGATWGMLKGALDVYASGLFKKEIQDEEIFFHLVENLLFNGLLVKE